MRLPRESTLCGGTASGRGWDRTRGVRGQGQVSVPARGLPEEVTVEGPEEQPGRPRNDARRGRRTQDGLFRIRCQEGEASWYRSLGAAKGENPPLEWGLDTRGVRKGDGKKKRGRKAGAETAWEPAYRKQTRIQNSSTASRDRVGLPAGAAGGGGGCKVRDAPDSRWEGRNAGGINVLAVTGNAETHSSEDALPSGKSASGWAGNGDSGGAGPGRRDFCKACALLRPAPRAFPVY